MTITVTAEHIVAGTPGDCRMCPVALAMKDAGFKEVRVCMAGYRLNPIGVPGEMWTKLPWAAERFIRDFDRLLGRFRFQPKPFSFEIKETV